MFHLTVEKIARWSPEVWSAGGTIGATIVALFLPLWSTKREWARQNRLRVEDAASAQKLVVDIHREVCSTVDQILAYNEACQRLFAPLNELDINQALCRIETNCEILQKILSDLRNRVLLTSGGLYIATAAQSVANAIIIAIRTRFADLTNNPGSGSTNLKYLEILHNVHDIHSVTSFRLKEIRKSYNISESTEASQITLKY